MDIVIGVVVAWAAWLVCYALLVPIGAFVITLLVERDPIRRVRMYELLTAVLHLGAIALAGYVFYRIALA